MAYPDAEHVAQQLQNNARFRAAFVVDQHVEESVASILEPGPKQPVALAALQSFVDELPVDQFRGIVSEKARDFGRHPLTQQDTGRSRLVEQALEELVVWLGRFGHCFERVGNLSVLYPVACRTGSRESATASAHVAHSDTSVLSSDVAAWTAFDELSDLSRGIRGAGLGQ